VQFRAGSHETQQPAGVANGRTRVETWGENEGCGRKVRVQRGRSPCAGRAVLQWPPGLGKLGADRAGAVVLYLVVCVSVNLLVMMKKKGWAFMLYAARTEGLGLPC